MLLSFARCCYSAIAVIVAVGDVDVVGGVDMNVVVAGVVVGGADVVDVVDAVVDVIVVDVIIVDVIAVNVCC